MGAREGWRRVPAERRGSGSVRWGSPQGSTGPGGGPPPRVAPPLPPGAAPSRSRRRCSPAWLQEGGERSGAERAWPDGSTGTLCCEAAQPGCMPQSANGRPHAQHSTACTAGRAARAACAAGRACTTPLSSGTSRFLGTKPAPMPAHHGHDGGRERAPWRAHTRGAGAADQATGPPHPAAALFLPSKQGRRARAPWILCGPGLPPLITGLSVGSTAITCSRVDWTRGRGSECGRQPWREPTRAVGQ